MSYVDRAALPGVDDSNLANKPLQVRLLYMLGVAVLGYLTFNALILLAIIQFVYLGVNKSKNVEIARFSSNLLAYLGEVLAFVLFLDDKPPFPFAPFPANKLDNH